MIRNLLAPLILILMAFGVRGGYIYYANQQAKGVASAACSTIQESAMFGASRQSLDTALGVLKKQGYPEAEVIHYVSGRPQREADLKDSAVQKFKCDIALRSDVFYLVRVAKIPFFGFGFFILFGSLSLLGMLWLLVSSSIWSVIEKRVIARLRSLISNEVSEMNTETRDSLFSRVLDRLVSKPSLSSGLDQQINSVLQEKERLESKERISTAQQVKHDVSGPISAILAVAKLDEQISPENRSLLENAAVSLHAICDDLTISANDRNPGCLVEVAVSDIVAEKQISLKGAESKVKLSLTSIPKNLSTVRADKVTLKRILSNIIQNAVEAVSEDGLVELKVKPLNNRVKIEVVDNGCGMDRTTAKKVFNKGFTQGKEKGSGLGLAHAKKMIDFWSGKITVSSKEGVGTKVSIFLPVENTNAEFISDLDGLTSGSRLIAMLDDSELWLKRGKAFGKDSNFMSFSDPESLIDWADTQAQVAGIDDISFIIDFDLKSTLNGVEVIDRLGIRNRSVLLTESYSDENVVRLCGERGVPIAPKSLAFSKIEGF